ncbi:MAG: hypothetical protein AABW65_00760 [Nanoarchaeota archaeon]
MKKRGQTAWDNLIPWIIGIIVLALVVIFYMSLSDKSTGALKFIRDILRFGK